MTDPSLVPLLEIQTVDSAIRDAEIRAAELPEREAVEARAIEVAEGQTELARVVLEREAFQAKEGEVSESVASLAKEIESAEVARYSGKQKTRDEAVSHDEEQRERRGKQAELEEEQMTLLESIEEQENRESGLHGRIEAAQAEVDRLTQVIRDVEAEVAAEIERHLAQKESLCETIPASVLAAYEAVRTQKGKAGRGAAPLGEGICGSCRIKLPSLEYRRMVEAEEGSLLQCPQCRRVLVRA